MALTLAIIPPAQTIVAGQTMNFVASVTNAGSASVTLQALSVNEITESDAQVSQPYFMIPNAPPTTGNPVLLAGSTYYYPFQAVFTSPAYAGPSPNNPGGAAPSSLAVTPDAVFALQIQSQSSDGTLASANLTVSSQATIAPFPIPQGGALQMNQGANLINFLLFA